MIVLSSGMMTIGRGLLLCKLHFQVMMPSIISGVIIYGVSQFHYIFQQHNEYEFLVLFLVLVLSMGNYKIS